MIPRSYQIAAVNETFDWLTNNDGNPLIVMPTGTGKSIVIAKIIEVAIQYPNSRIIVCTHSQELVEQDYLEFVGLCPFVNAGIYCAGLKEKNIKAQILFCSIQSVYDKAFDIQQCDILLPDEAQGISRKAESMWGQFIKDLLIINPKMRVVGLTATEYRLDSGHLVGGKGAMFHAVSYEYPLLEAIQEGYLVELIPKRMATKYDVSKVAKRGGDFIPGKLEDAINVDEITRSAINELIEYGLDRKCWLVFGAGIDHVNKITKEIKSRGIECEGLTKDTPKGLRREYIEAHKNGELRSLVSGKILTVGYNNKKIDLIADMDPTMSAGKHVQKLGRGTRALYALGYDLDTREGRLGGISASQKPNCLILDYARNGSRFGPIDQIKGSAFKEKGSGEAPVKVCPKCHCTCFAGSVDCPDCGFEFPQRDLDIASSSADDAILSTQIKQQKPLWHKVVSTQYTRHKGKNGKQDTFRVKYTTYTGDYNEFLGFEHIGFAREKACQWHRKRFPAIPAPNTIDGALMMRYPCAEEVLVQMNGKYGNVIDVKIAKDGLAEILPPIEEERPINNILAEVEDIGFD